MFRAPSLRRAAGLDYREGSPAAPLPLQVQTSSVARWTTYIATRLRGSVAATISLDGPAQTSYIDELT